MRVYRAISESWTEDSDGNRTCYAYDPAGGRQTAVTNALGLAVRYGHDTQGRVVRTWGDTPYPVSYAFDDYGRMTNMATYRGGTGWEGASWPTGTTGTADATAWLHDPALSGSDLEPRKQVDGGLRT